VIRIFLLFFSAGVFGLSARNCEGDGVHPEIDIRQLQIQYAGISVRSTFDAIAKLGVDARTVQTAAEETQKVNQYLQALATGFNSCAISKAQYFDATQVILPRAKQDVVSIEAVRKELAAGRTVTENRLQAFIQSYFGNLKELAGAAGLQADVLRLEAKMQTGFDQVNRKLDNVLDRLPNPVEVSTEIDGKLNAKKDEAKTAYAQGFKLMEGYQFKEAVPYFQRALGIVRLPDFYLALSIALLKMPDLNGAEAASHAGLALLVHEPDEKAEAELSNQLGLILKEKGDLAGAQRNTERALQIDEKVYGPDHPTVAICASNLGQILKEKGDLKGAQRYTERALQIDEKAYGPEHPTTRLMRKNLELMGNKL
jgi:tetratricopeptide (TPR) repeat protein